MADGRSRGLSSPERVLALTDGVFAIVLTLLVLEITVPEDLSAQSLRQVLTDLRPTAVAWAISFLITGMYWVSHRDLFLRVAWVNRDVVWLNLLFLLPVGLVPFGASVLGSYPDEAIALQAYGCVLVLASAMRLVLFAYVAHRPELLAGEVPARMGLGLVVAAAPIPVYAIAMLVADVSTTASLVLYFAVPILYFLLITLLRDRRGAGPDTGDLT